MKTYRGSCHCGAVRFEADVDLQAGTTKCNCTSCWKRRWWGTSVKPAAFRLLAGVAATTQNERGGFCRECGVTAYNVVNTDGWGVGDGGDMVSINVAALDDLPVEVLLAAPITYCNGRDDDWWHAPEETRHL